MATYQNRIMARSPYYITATGAALITSATLEVYVWHGDNTAKPATPNYTIAKNALTSTSTNIVFEISALIRDSFNHISEVNTASDGDFIDCVWVETELDVVQTTAPNPATVNNLYLAFDGYTYYEDEANYSGVAYVTRLIINDHDNIRFPVFADTSSVDTIEYVSGVIGETLGGTVETTTSLAAEATSISSYDKTQYLDYLDVNKSITAIRLLDGTILVSRILIYRNEECKYTPKTLKYINKDGMLQELVMFTKSSESLSVTKSKYNSIITELSAGAYTYNANKHQYKTYNVNGKEKVVLNSGWVIEDLNENFKQLLLSEFVWLDDVPVSVTTSNLQYKTQLNDKLINYTINIEYAKDVINNV